MRRCGARAARSSDERRTQFKAIIEDDNTALKSFVLPDYQQMLTIFREKMWLAEPQTRTYFPTLVEFIDVWERHLRGTLPGEVVQEIKHTEERLHPFYKHLEDMHDRLREVLARQQARGGSKVETRSAAVFRLARAVGMARR
jgi:uncharacterized protein Usg